MSVFRAKRITLRNPDGNTQRVYDLPPLAPRPRTQPQAEKAEHEAGRLDRLKEEMTLFRELFEQFLQFRLGDEQPDQKPALKRVWTPRSEDPLAYLHDRKIIPVQLIRGRVHFACPACQRPTELAGIQAGQKARCLICQSAIVVPLPGRQQRGCNMERDIESLLHPERFQAMPAQGWSALRTKHFHQARVIASLAALLILLVGNGYRKLLQQHTEPMFAPMAQIESAIPNAPSEEAEKLVRAYLAADGYRAKAAYVRDAERVLPLMEDYFSRHPGGVSVGWKSIQAQGTGFYEGAELAVPITKVAVETVAGNFLEFTVEHSTAGPQIEWESSLGYSPKDWPAVLASRLKVAPLRVMAALDDYYNFDFNNEREQMCIRLQDPSNQELLGYGYLDRSDPAARDLRAILEDASPEDPRPVVVEVSANEHSPTTKQVRIMKLVSEGWRTPTPTPTMASVP